MKQHNGIEIYQGTPIAVATNGTKDKATKKLGSIAEPVNRCMRNDHKQ
jgi:hypothetical protein